MSNSEEFLASVDMPDHILTQYNGKKVTLSALLDTYINRLINKQ